jgi:hypothetical protein
MKKMMLLLALMATASAFGQTITSSFDGSYERREWRTKERPLPDTDLTIKGAAGTFQQYASKKTKSDACSGKTVPVDVVKVENNKITLTVKLSQIMAQCQDFTATFQTISANGKSGLGLPNSDEVMFVKK